MPKNGDRFSQKIRLMVRNIIASPRQILDDIALCLVFFTRLPLPVFDFRGRSLAAAIWAAPIAGLVVGLIGAIVFATAERFGLAMDPAAALALVATVITTGCLHEDGLSDVADGFGGGKSRGGKLEIMRDSRIGAHGAAALCLLLIAKTFAVAAALEHRDLLALLMFPMIGRWAVTPTIVLHPYARDEGLGRAFHGEARMPHVATATIFVVAAVAAFGLRFFTPAAGALLAAMLFAFWLRWRLGGLTGDVYGATIELAEVVALTLCTTMT